MKLFDDLKYVGNDNKLSFYGNKPWHCTSFAKEFSTGEMKFCVQQPYYHDGIFMGYTNMDIYVLTEDELVANFKVIKEDGTLEDIIHSKNDTELQKYIKEDEDYIKNMSDEEFIKLFNGD